MRICYIAETDFSRKNATAVRIIGCSKAIEYNSENIVTHLGFSNEPQMNVDGFSVYNVKRGHSTLAKIFNTLTRPSQFIEKLKEIDKPDVIIYYAIYGNSASTLRKLKGYCKGNGIKLIVDVTEWYEYKLLPYGEYGPKARDVKKSITKIIPTCDGVIAISSYLENYFKGRGTKVIRIPLILDTASENINTNSRANYFDNSRLNLVYAGFPGNKELIADVARSVISLHNQGHAIRLNILGMDSTTFATLSHLEPSDAIVCHGRINQNEVVNYLQSADFSVLIRQDILNTRAGFPTKFVESLNAGLPVIANITSDLADYLVDGHNGIIALDSSQDSIEASLLQALKIDKEQLSQMRVSAKETAQKNFDFRTHSNQIKQFIENVQ